MAYNVGNYLLNKKTIASGPNTYAWLRYDQAKRTGKNVYLKFYIKTDLQYDSSYRADACSVNLWISYSRLNDDGTTTWTDVSIFNGVHKPQKSGSSRSGTGWPKDRTVDITVPTAASNMLININIWDSTGACDYDWYMGTQTINIPPGAPILANSGSPSVLCNKATWTIYDTLGFTCTEYKVFNGDTEIQHVTNVDSSTFNITITGLSPNIEYSGYKVQALANGVWSDKISLTTIKTTSLPECILSYNPINGNIYLGWPNSWRSTANPRLSLVSGTIAIPNNNVNFSVDNNTQRDDYDVNYDYFLLHTLTTSDKDKIANANQSSNNGNISVTWMRTVDNGYYDQSASFSVDISSYKPIFYSNYITSVIDTLSYMTNNITNSNTVFIKGLNLPQVTFAKMAPNYSYPDYYNITNYGNLVVSSGTETDTHTIIMNTPLSDESFDITAYNGRGSRKATKTIDMIEYSKPAITFFDAVRTNGIGTTVDITISGTYTKWRSGLKVNNSLPTIQYSINGGTSWSSLALSPTYNNNGTWSASMRLPGEYSLDNSYPVKIRLLDQVGKVLSDNNSPYFYGWTESNVLTIPTGKVMLWKDVLRKWLGIGKRPTCALDVVGNIKADTYSPPSIQKYPGAWPLYRQVVDLTSLDQSYYFIVTGSSLPKGGLHRIKCTAQLENDSHPNWATHAAGFTYVCEVEVEQAGWGTTKARQNILSEEWGFTENNQRPGWFAQAIPSSTPVFMLRGGGKYHLYADYVCEWSIHGGEGWNIGNGEIWYPTQTPNSTNYVHINNLCDMIYPIGSVYITRLHPNEFNPNTIFGGNWRIIGGGYDERFLYVLSSNGHSSWENGSSGYGTSTDASDVPLQAHTHTGTTSTNGAHTHTYGSWKPKRASDGSKWPTADNSGDYTTSSNGDHNHTFTTDTAGSGNGSHSHTVHYIGVFVWERYN